MSKQHAMDNGLGILIELEKPRLSLTYHSGLDDTVGQVKTYRTFASGKRIPATFRHLAVLLLLRCHPSLYWNGGLSGLI